MDVEAIVERLNDAPFSKNLSLVSFDEKSWIELRELLQEVLIAIDPKQSKIDLRSESAEETATRVTDLLRILNFRASLDINALRAGNKEVVHSILAFLLGNWRQHQKRAYLAQFLIDVPVPPELLQDRDIAQALQQCRALQEEFKEAHKRVDRLRSQGFTPEQLEKDFDKMQADKEQLNSKINSLRKKLQSHRSFEELYPLCSRLRKELEEASKLSRRLRDQGLLLEQVDKHLAMAKSGKMIGPQASPNRSSPGAPGPSSAAGIARPAPSQGQAFGAVPSRPQSGLTSPVRVPTAGVGGMTSSMGRQTAGGPGTPGMRPPSGSLAGLNTTVSVPDRAVTAQGVSGLRGGPAGEGRQVQDRTYFLQELRKRIGAIKAECTKLSEEASRWERDSAKYSLLTRNHEMLQSELKDLQGRLGDLNVTSDKIRLDDDVDDVRSELEKLKTRNEADRKRCDSLFTERSRKEAQIKELEAQLASSLRIS